MKSRLPGVVLHAQLMLVLLCLLSLQAFGQQHPVQLHIDAAADLQPVMPVLAQIYEKKTGVKLVLSFGSSGALATQILNGAPVDVFLGADFTFPEKVVAAGLADEKLPVPYAKGTLVLWSRRDLAAPLNMDLLTDPRVTRIAVADEFHAPFGRAAYEALRYLKLFDRIKDKLVVAENVAQTAQFVESGNAQMGFISLTLANTDKLKAEGQFVRVPEIYPEIRQCAVIIKTSKHLDEAHKFLDWMRSSEVQQNLLKFGMEAVR
jgi:molybdate transport system substrate-binding protein